MSRPAVSAFDATVIGIEDLSPAFRRVTFGGPGLENFGINGHPRDLRLKLVIPPGEATEPRFDLIGFLAEQSAAGVPWYQAWLQVDESERGCMRTYTVREWRDDVRELVVDMVLHTDADGHSGPAAGWAETAQIGHRLHIIGPTRDHDGVYGGIEFDPGDADQILIAGDETAVPAIASIFESLSGRDVRGKAVIEVPTAADVLDLALPEGFEIEWLPRGDAASGRSSNLPCVRRSGLRAGSSPRWGRVRSNSRMSTSIPRSSGTFPRSSRRPRRAVRVRPSGRLDRSTRGSPARPDRSSGCGATSSRRSASTASRSRSWVTGVRARPS